MGKRRKDKYKIPPGVARTRPLSVEPLNKRIARIALVKPTATYADRNATLQTLGFPAYIDYLDSALWARIRRSVMERDREKCICCGSYATCVHHADYDRATLVGESMDRLVSLCHRCHDWCEIDWQGCKRPHDQANAALLAKVLNPGTGRRRKSDGNGRWKDRVIRMSRVLTPPNPIRRLAD